jgi:tRNA pseudouridine38-40 synthase
MRNIKLVIAYDGQGYLGWKKTKMGPSIEATLQQCIEQILQHPIQLQAASRTDAGVHATGQVVNFLTPKPLPSLDQLRLSLNRLLPKSIVIHDVNEMPLTFHPTLDCIEKEYRYFICHGPIQLPCHRFYSWHIPYSLLLTSIQEALPFLVGQHHFGAFCNVKKNARYLDDVRDIQCLELIELDPQRFYFRICGNHFLYKMVRNLVGTLIDIGRGKMKVTHLLDLLQSGQRTQAGVTAPAHGLFLHHVFYPIDLFRKRSND